MRSSVLVASAAVLTLAAAVGLDRCSREHRSVGVTVFPTFRPPDAAERERALGPLGPDLSPVLRAAFDPGGDFLPMTQPAPEDWLSCQHEAGQTFAQFLAANPNWPDSTRAVLYLQPLGSFEERAAPSTAFLRRFAEGYFGLPVRLQPPMRLDSPRLTRRRDAHGSTQLLTSDLLELLSRDLPADALCRLGITMEDHYAGRTWNFVFGQASLTARVGVYSFARYAPAGKSRPPTAPLLRACKVLSHETGHIFGLWHCIYYSCLMNGSNHLAELDRRPLHLCPVCLRKLQHSAGFDALERFRRLQDLCGEAGFEQEARWYAARIRTVATAAVEPVQR